jgi:hypothetical protein
VRDTGEVLELIENIKKKSKKINFYIPIYPDTDTEIGDIEFFKEYEIPAERTGRKIVTDIKNSVRSQSFSKRRKLIRS